MGGKEGRTEWGGRGGDWREDPGEDRGRGSILERGRQSMNLSADSPSRERGES